jgi:hypothetical protein
MKKYVLLSLLAFAIATTGISQARPCRVASFNLPVKPSQQELSRRDLAWIKTCNDFNQSSLTSEAIDKEIENRIKGYDLETPIVTFDVPINTKQLVKTTGKKLFKDFDPSYNLANLKDLPLEKEVYFWKYRDIDISVRGDDYLDQYLVYSTARALEILRCRYPKAYQQLFIESRKFSQQAPTLGSFINRFKAILLSFHNDTKSAIAEGGTLLGKNEDPNGPYGKYPNLAVISLHEENLRGNTTYGSSVLYKKSADENFIRYLREGLVETLVHEMLHRFIETKRKIDEMATIITDARDNPLPLNLQWEEIFITNTSLSFFVKEGGLQPPIVFYYRGVLEGNIAAIHNLRLAGIPNDASKITSLGCCNYEESMRLNYLD